MPLGTLVEYWRDYKAAIAARPYLPDHVQAMGMRFRDEWVRCKDIICKQMNIAPEEFEYQLHHIVMPQIAETISSTN